VLLFFLSFFLLLSFFLFLELVTPTDVLFPI